MTRLLIFIAILAAIAGGVALWFHPVSSRSLKLALCGYAAVVWVGFTFLTWHRRRLRTVALMLPVLAAVPFLLPGGRIDEVELRDGYAARLADYEGTPYFWGGETRRGIDCSGLPRRALRDALISYGIRNASGPAFREFMEHWWFDASATALMNGYRDYTIPIGTTGSIQKMDYSDLRPGDLAVTADGLHLLVYKGNTRWIQADPGSGAVLTLDGRTGRNSWFKSRVTTHRWTILAHKPATGIP